MDILREAMRDLDEMVRIGGKERFEKSKAWYKPRKSLAAKGSNSPFVDDVKVDRMERLMDGEDVPEATEREIDAVKNRLNAAADQIENLVTFYALDDEEAV